MGCHSAKLQVVECSVGVIVVRESGCHLHASSSHVADEDRGAKMMLDTIHSENSYYVSWD